MMVVVADVRCSTGNATPEARLGQWLAGSL